MRKLDRLRTKDESRVHPRDESVYRSLGRNCTFFLNSNNRIWWASPRPWFSDSDIPELLKLEYLINFEASNPGTNNDGITDASATLLREHSRLCCVHFRNCSNITNAAVTAILQNKWIRWIDFGGPEITDELSNSFSQMKHLIKINFSYTGITEKSVESFSNLSAARKLRLYGCDISDSGIARIKELLPNCKVLC